MDTRRGKNNAAAKPGRTFKAELPDKISLEAGDSYTGVFQRAGEIEITDKQTGEEKSVVQYMFRNTETGKKEAMLGAFQLNMTFEDLFESEGGQDKLQGVTLRIDRGADSKLKGKRTMGNYEITIIE